MSAEAEPVYQAGCTFCEIARGQLASHRVYQDARTLAFLDHRPLFPGHCLLITRSHFRTLADLPPDWIEPVFAAVQRLSEAVREAMGGEGTFIGINNGVSQSVPHFHVHVVPRKKGDGLRGFFWPRRPYKDAAEIQATLAALDAAIRERK